MSKNKNLAHKTAISRKSPSAPSKLLKERGLIKGRSLDYGCGKGADADFYGMDKYDPHFYPKPPKGKYDTIVCHYVLNVIPEKEQNEVLANIRRLLKKGGKAYIGVRRDIKKEGFTSRGTFQRNVELDLPVVAEKKGSYCLYILENQEVSAA